MIETAVGILNVPELEALVSLNIELAARYQSIAEDPDAEPRIRRTAQALGAWRRARARYFQRECAETERVEAAHERDLSTGSGSGPGSAEHERGWPGPVAGPPPHHEAVPTSGATEQHQRRHDVKRQLEPQEPGR